MFNNNAYYGVNINQFGELIAEKRYVNSSSYNSEISIIEELVKNQCIFPFEGYYCNSKLKKIGYHVGKTDCSIKIVKEVVKNSFPFLFNRIEPIVCLLEKLGLSLLSFGVKKDTSYLTEVCLYYYRLNASGKITPLPTIVSPIENLLSSDELLVTNRDLIELYLANSNLKIIGISLSDKNIIGYKFYSEFQTIPLLDYLIEYYNNSYSVLSKYLKDDYKLLLTGFVVKSEIITHNFYYI